MSVMQDLKLLRDDITASKEQLSTNLNTKGIETISTEPLSQMVNKVSTISQTVEVVDNKQRWLDIGYTGEPSYIARDVAYATGIYNSWDANNNNLHKLFENDEQLVYMPLVDTSKVEIMKDMFMGCVNLRCVPSLNVSKVWILSGMFSNCTSLTTTPDINWDSVLPSQHGKGPKLMDRVFYGCTSLKTANMPNTSTIGDMERLFAYCTSLKSVIIDTSSTVKYSQMFMGCESLTDLSVIDINSWKQSLPAPDDRIYLTGMFENCKSLKTIKLRGNFWDGEGAWHDLDPWVKGMFDGIAEEGILYYEPIGNDNTFFPIEDELLRTHPKWKTQKTIF